MEKITHYTDHQGITKDKIFTKIDVKQRKTKIVCTLG